MSTAIRDASVSLKDRLHARLNADPDVVGMLPPGVAVDVSLNTPDEMAEASARGLSLWLYRIVRDSAALNLPPRRAGRDRMRPPPLPIKLHYLVTPVFEGLTGVSAPEFEHALLSKVLQHFYDEPTLAGVDLKGGLAGQDLELAVRLETLELDDVARVWDALERSYQLCISYEVTTVPIDGRREFVSGPPVLDAVYRVGAAEIVS